MGEGEAALSPLGAGPGSPSQHLVGDTLPLVKCSPLGLGPPGDWWEAWGPGLVADSPPRVDGRSEWEMGSDASYSGS